MFGRCLSAFALVMSCASAPALAIVDPSYGRDCWDERELEALRLQRFKTMLLVGMLNCRDMEPGIAEDYNHFVRANRALLAETQASVRGRFARTHGEGRGMDAHSTFETSLGNRYSDADFDDRRCGALADEARMASQVSPAELMDIVQSMPDEDRMTVCRAEPRLATRWAPVQPPLYAETPAALPTPDVAAAPPPPAPMPEKAVEPPVEVAAADTQDWPDLAAVEPEGPARAVDPNSMKAEAEEKPVAVAEVAAEEAEPVQVAAVDVPAPIDRMAAVRDAARALREALAALEAAEPAAK